MAALVPPEPRRPWRDYGLLFYDVADSWAKPDYHGAPGFQKKSPRAIQNARACDSWATRSRLDRSIIVWSTGVV